MNQRVGMLLLALVLAVAACSSGREDDSLSVDQEVDYFLGIASPDLIEQIETTVAVRRGDLTRQCMEDAGYDYTAPDPRSTFALSPQLTLTREAFAEQFGLGVIKFSGPNAVSLGSPEVADDPNGAVLAKLTPAGRESWVNQEGECSAAALADATVVADLAGITEAVAEFHSRVAADRRVVEASALWSACMGSAGYSYANREAMMHDVKQAVERLFQAGAAEEGAPNHDEWHHQEEREMAIAAADADCRVDFDAVVDVVMLELRGEFFDTYSTHFARPR